MIKNITVIITLYKTPLNQLQNLKNYKSFKLIIFEQEGSEFSRNKIKNFLGRNFEYYFSKKNIGLPKASNFLFKKIKTKYFLFTQADIVIQKEAILKLSKIFKTNKDIISIAPNFSNKKLNTQKKDIVKYLKKIDAACMLCDYKKIKRIKFFDDDYFLYWEDVDLINRINSSGYKMVKLINVYAKHLSSRSSKNDFKTSFLRTSNYTFGEFLFDYKNDNLRFLKIFRKFFQNIITIFFMTILLNFRVSFNRLFQLIGIIKFISYYIKKTVIKFFL